MRGVRGCKLQRQRAHHMLAGRTIASKAAGFRSGGSLLWSTLLQIIISQVKMGCEQRLRACISSSDNGHKHLNMLMTVIHVIVDKRRPRGHNRRDL